MFRKSIMLALGLLLIAGVGAQADWDPGQPHKMHYPQLPDQDGWDVNFVQPKVLADDWMCSETGPVSDIHFWMSFRYDFEFPITGVHASIHTDIPVGPFGYSQPGDLLWQRDFSPTEITLRPWGTGDQGWYDPNTGEAVRPDHQVIWQVNIVNIPDPFIQKEGTVYWLDLFVLTDQPTPSAGAGWKTSLDHFRDDAVWADWTPGVPPIWRELRDPTTGESLDLAFVITPEPGSMLVLGSGVLGLAGVVIRRRK